MVCHRKIKSMCLQTEFLLSYGLYKYMKHFSQVNINILMLPQTNQPTKQNINVWIILFGLMFGILLV